MNEEEVTGRTKKAKQCYKSINTQQTSKAHQYNQFKRNEQKIETNPKNVTITKKTKTNTNNQYSSYTIKI